MNTEQVIKVATKIMDALVDEISVTIKKAKKDVDGKEVLFISREMYIAGITKALVMVPNEKRPAFLRAELEMLANDIWGNIGAGEIVVSMEQSSIQ